MILINSFQILLIVKQAPILKMSTSKNNSEINNHQQVRAADDSEANNIEMSEMYQGASKPYLFSPCDNYKDPKQQLEVKIHSVYWYQLNLKNLKLPQGGPNILLHRSRISYSKCNYFLLIASS